jgi:dihydroceramidase
MTQLILSLPPTSVHPARRIITKLFFTGLAIFVSGFLIWNVDNIFCTELRKMKEVLLSYGGVVGKIAWLLEGHAWWHLATGYGAYLIITGSTCKWANSEFHL